MIRPHLEYACAVWYPFRTKDLDKLEAVQKFAARVCTGNWRAGYPDLLSSTSIPTLTNQSLKTKFATCSKYYMASQFFHHDQLLTLLDLICTPIIPLTPLLFADPLHVPLVFFVFFVPQHNHLVEFSPFLSCHSSSISAFQHSLGSFVY